MIHHNAVRVGGLFLLAVMTGCARPAGRMFPPLKTPMAWPHPPEPPRIRLIGTLAGSRDLHAARSGAEVFKAALRGPRPPITFSGPNMIAVGPTGKIAITDGGLSAVHIVDLNLRTHSEISGWSDQERFYLPIGVTWDEGRLFVTDAQRHEVIELDSEGRYRRRFGADILGRPVGITYVKARNQLYVVDGAAHQIVVFNPDGTEVRRLGRRGTEPGEFNYPSYVCSAGDRLIVADSGNSRVELLDLDGNCIKVIGQKGDGAGDLSLPKGVAFDGDGHVYVVDAHFENVQVFNQKGQLLMAFGQEGDQPGEFSLPAGLAIDNLNRIWVADSANHRLQLFEYLGSTP